MDAVQEICKQTINKNVKTFVVSGASKRGWTTWLIGANDRRVEAIAPMVIDMLNMPVSMNYQIKVWNDYSIQIEDYVKLGIVQDMGTNKSNDLVTMIDPYSYRKKLTMPKMLIMGTNDEYWPIDNVKNYFDSIPGNNFIHYIPNVGHSMGDKVESSSNLGSFFAYTLANKTYPECSWKTSISKNAVNVKLKATANKLTNVVVWYADSPDKDFRNDTWKSKILNIKNRSNIVVKQELPASGYRAFYVNLQYTDPNGIQFSESTRVFMTDDKTVL
jgi:PhoPQ-activated pathogenicity-related protein